MQSLGAIDVSPEVNPVEILALALALGYRGRRAALALIAVDAAYSGGRRAEPEDAVAIAAAKRHR